MNKKVRILKKIKKNSQGLWIVKTSDKTKPFWLADLSTGYTMGTYRNLSDAEKDLKFWDNPELWENDLVRL